MTRAEHLAWCKERALEYLSKGDLASAVASMGSDLTKHPETGCNNALMHLGMIHIINNNRDAIKAWIEGFN
jgi:hypothetical protein